MAITRIKNSGIKTGVLKYDSVLGGYPPLMPAPTAADGGTGTTATVTFNTVTGATSYTALSTPGSFTGTGTTSPITVSGLSSGTAYTFQVRAQNAVGNGPYSAASNSVTPTTPPSFESLASTTLNSTTSTVTFSSISGSYQHLQLRCLTRSNTTSQVQFWIRFNSDSGSNYTFHRLSGQGSATSAAGATGNSEARSWYVTESDRAADIFGGLIADIHDYKSTTKNKTVRFFTGYDVNGSGGWVSLTSSAWLSTSAITSITVGITGGASYVSGSVFSLYGIKG